MNKSALRQIIRHRLAGVLCTEREKRSHEICQRLISALSTRQPRITALYVSLEDEVCLDEVIRTLAATSVVLLPRVEGEDMNFYPYHTDSLQIGAFGISEPQGGNPIPPEEIDVMIVPGRAFTCEGARLGRGRGYYDRYLSKATKRPLLIGVCFQEQIVDEIPTEPHDIKMDEVIFE